MPKPSDIGMSGTFRWRTKEWQSLGAANGMWPIHSSNARLNSISQWQVRDWHPPPARNYSSFQDPRFLDVDKPLSSLPSLLGESATVAKPHLLFKSVPAPGQLLVQCQGGVSTSGTGANVFPEDLHESEASMPSSIWCPKQPYSLHCFISSCLLTNSTCE